MPITDYNMEESAQRETNFWEEWNLYILTWNGEKEDESWT